MEGREETHAGQQRGKLSRGKVSKKIPKSARDHENPRPNAPESESDGEADKPQKWGQSGAAN